MQRFDTLEEAMVTYCEEHNVKGCACCNKVVGECDFGACQTTATHTVELLNAKGFVGEVRPSCARHVQLIRQGQTHGVGDVSLIS